MARPLRLFFLSLGILGAAALIVWAFIEGRNELAKEREREKPTLLAPRLVTDASGTSVLVDAETQKRIGLRVEPLRAASHPPLATAYGKLEEDPSSSFVLRAQVWGVVRAAKDHPWPSVGQSLDRGVIGEIEPRFDLAVQFAAAQAEVANAEAAVTVAGSTLAFAKASLDRIHEANKEHQVDPQDVIQKAENEVVQAQANLEAAKIRLEAAKKALAAFPPTAGSRLSVTLESTGEVAEVMARPGETVQAGDPLLRLARYDRLIARVALPVGESCNCEAAAAQVLPVGWKGAPIAAQRTALVASTDGQTFLFLLEAKGTGLRPGIAVTAYLEIPGVRESGVEVPGPAVVRHLGKAWAYAQTGDGKFTRREVQTDAPTANGWFVASGLAADVPVVVEGAQLLLSEELKAEIQVGEEGD